MTTQVRIAFSFFALLAPRVALAEDAPCADPSCGKDAYLVLPFENTQGNPALDPYTGALAQTLAERLESHPQLRPAYGPEVLPSVQPNIGNDEIVKLAQSQGARFVIAGRFERKPDWRIWIEERMLLVDGQGVRELAKADGMSDKDHVQELVLTVASDLLAKSARPVPPAAAAQVGRRMTSDPYAFYLFGKAIASIRGYGKTAVNPKRADELLHKLINIDPKFAEAHRLRGWFHLEQGLPQKARGEYSYALELKRDYYLPLVGLARMYRTSGNRQQALELVGRALELRPYDAQARFIYGELLYEDAKLDEAYAELKKVVQAAPQHLGARRTLVLIHAARGAGEELAQELEGLVSLEPDDLDARLDLASAYQRIGELDKGIAAYQAVLERKPKSSAAVKFLADLYRARGDFDKATDLYKQLVKQRPDDPRAYFLLGATYVQAGRDAKAELIFQDAQQFRKYQGEAWTNLGAICYRRGDISRALWYLERAVQKLPQRPKVHYNLGLALSAAKQRDRAMDELRTAATLDPDDAEIRYALGVVLLRQGKLDDAAKEFRQAVERKPDHQDAQHNLNLIEDLQRRVGEREILAPSLMGEPDLRPSSPERPQLLPGSFGPELPPGFKPGR